MVNGKVDPTVELDQVRFAFDRWRRRKRHVLTIFRKELGFVMVWT